MLGVLHVRLEHPGFGSPTRDRLTNPAVGEAVRAIVERDFARHLEEVPALLDALLLDLAPLRVVRPRDTVRVGHGGRP
jgi:DNA gyrase/topoisomerase IV subunit B